MSCACPLLLFLTLTTSLLAPFSLATDSPPPPLPAAPPGWRMTDRFHGFRFEIHGTVQGVWFRKSTQEKADELACFGWVQNTRTNTVVGEARCGKRAGKIFQEWFNTGPATATVERSHIKVYKDTKIKLHFSDFAILEDTRQTCFRDDGPHSCAAMPESTGGATTGASSNNNNDDHSEL